MRQYGEVLPVPPSDPPAISTIAGLGTGGGAGVQSQVGQSGWGHVVVKTGLNPLANGNVHLVFGSAPPSLFVAGDESFGPLGVTGQGTTDIVIAWTSATLLPQHTYRINYEWAVSR